MTEGNSILEKIEAGIKKSNSLIARDIVENSEKFGVSPVISIDGQLKNLRPKILECEEIKNLPKILKEHNYNIDDFYFFESKTSKYGKNKSTLLAGFIICIFKKSGKIREYKANQKQSWLDILANDLKEKLFE